MHRSSVLTPLLLFAGLYPAFVEGLVLVNVRAQGEVERNNAQQSSLNRLC